MRDKSCGDPSITPQDMPSRPTSLNLDIQDEERDIGDALLSSGSIPSSSRTFVGFQSGKTPRTTGLTPAHASSPNVSTRRTPSPDMTRPQGLKISGPSLPASLSRSISLPRRVSERSTADISEIEHGHDPQPGFSKLNVLPIGLDSAAVNRVQRWVTGIALGKYSRPSISFHSSMGPSGFRHRPRTSGVCCLSVDGFDRIGCI